MGQKHDRDMNKSVNPKASRWRLPAGMALLGFLAIAALDKRLRELYWLVGLAWSLAAADGLSVSRQDSITLTLKE